MRDIFLGCAITELKKKIQYTSPVDDMPYYLNVTEERSFAITVSVVCKLHVHT